MTRDENHSWTGCKCKVCGKVRSDMEERIKIGVSGAMGMTQPCLVIRFPSEEAREKGFDLLAKQVHAHVEKRESLHQGDEIIYRERRSAAPGRWVVVVDVLAPPHDTCYTPEYELLRRERVDLCDIDSVSYQEIFEVTRRRSGRPDAVSAKTEQGPLERLIRELDDADVDVRIQACVGLRELGDRAAVPALADALRDRNEYVARYAAEALGALGDERAIRPLEEAAREPGRMLAQIYAQDALKMLRKGGARGQVLQ